jgi:hypothetical protein
VGRFWFALAIGAIVGAASPSSDQCNRIDCATWDIPEISYPPTDQSGKNASNQKERGTEDFPIVVKVAKPEKTQQEIDAEKAEQTRTIEEGKRKAEVDKNLVNLTGDLALYTKLLFFATAALVIGTGILARIGYIEIGHGKESMRLAERAHISAEQAFLSSYSVTLNAVLREDGSVLGWVFSPQWKNSGSTAARYVVMHANTHCEASMGGLPDDFTYPEQWDADEREVSTISIGAQGEITDGPKFISIGYLVSAMLRQRRIFIYGWAEYNDIFPNTLRHRTEYCTEIVVRSNPQTNPGTLPGHASPFTFSFQGKHNGAEDECYGKPQPHQQKNDELRESRRLALAPREGDIVRPEHNEFMPPESTGD